MFNKLHIKVCFILQHVSSMEQGLMGFRFERSLFQEAEHFAEHKREELQRKCGEQKEQTIRKI